VPSALLASKKGIKSASAFFWEGGLLWDTYIQFLALSLIESLHCCTKCSVQTARIMLISLVLYCCDWLCAAVLSDVLYSSVSVILTSWLCAILC
jgi:hypothetical protein